MAINGSGNGHDYDPSKRIRASLGDEFVSNVEAESTERLAQAMASSAIKNNGREYVEEGNDVSLKEIFKKTTHTTEAGEKLQEQANKKYENAPSSNLDVRLSDVKLTEKRLTELISKKSLPETLIRSASGFGIKDNAKQNLTHAANFTIKNISAFIEADLVEPIVSGFNANNKDRVKAVSAAVGVSAAFDFVSSLCTNNQRINSIFDQNSISASELKLIKSAIQKEKIKYAAEHTAASVIIPSLAKIGLTKVIGQDKINSNNILKVATSYGTLSTVGKLALSGIRKVSEKKQIAKINSQQYSVANNAPTSYYAELAKVSTNHVLNEGLDNTLIGTVFGTVAGLTVAPMINSETDRPSLAGYKAESSLVEKPAVKVVEKAPKVAAEVKATSSKKTA